jgi:hypothetical protein
MSTPENKVNAKPKAKAESLQRSVISIGAVVFASYFLTIWQESQPWYTRHTRQLSDLIIVLPNWVPIAVVSVYFVLVMWHLYVRSAASKQVARERTGPGSATNHVLVAWNYFLHLISAVMLVGFLRHMSLFVGQGKGLMPLVCDAEPLFSPDETITFWSHMFMWSKFPELIDTLLLVRRGRGVLFLHWYHHITVLLYCWMVTKIKYPGVIFATMNAAVHTIMYYYYARMAQGVRPAFGKVLTSVQLGQMGVGVICVVYFTMYGNLYPEDCQGSRLLQQDGGFYHMWALLATVVMYGSYFFLFAVFYLNKYSKKKEQ